MLLTSGSLLGAICIAIFGWLTFQGLNKATDELEQEAKKSGSSSNQHADVMAFLDTTRGIFVTMEIYPKDYDGVFSIAYDAIALAKEVQQVIRLYFENFPDEIILPTVKGIIELENAISKVQKLNSQRRNSNLLAQQTAARKNYDIKERLLSSIWIVLKSRPLKT